MITETGWFTSFEMPEVTAKAVHEKNKKYFAILEKTGSGKYIVKWRGLTPGEQDERKRQKAMARRA